MARFRAALLVPSLGLREPVVLPSQAVENLGSDLALLKVHPGVRSTIVNATSSISSSSTGSTVTGSASTSATTSTAISSHRTSKHASSTTTERTSEHTTTHAAPNDQQATHSSTRTTFSSFSSRSQTSPQAGSSATLVNNLTGSVVLSPSIPTDSAMSPSGGSLAPTGSEEISNNKLPIILGSSIGGAVLLIVIVVIFFVLRQRKRRVSEVISMNWQEVKSFGFGDNSVPQSPLSEARSSGFGQIDERLRWMKLTESYAQYYGDVNVGGDAGPSHTAREEFPRRQQVFARRSGDDDGLAPPSERDRGDSPASAMSIGSTSTGTVVFAHPPLPPNPNLPAGQNVIQLEATFHPPSVIIPGHSPSLSDKQLFHGHNNNPFNRLVANTSTNVTMTD